MFDRLRNYFRVAATISCRDCDYIPRVSKAGLVVKNEPEYQVMFNGIKILKGSYHGDWMTYVITCLGGHHEPQEEKVFYEVLKDLDAGATMIEAGSYWAYYSCWFQHEIKSANSYLIEPNAKKLEFGKNNFKLNGFDGDFSQGFIGSTSAERAEFFDWDNTGYVLKRFSIDEFANDKNIQFIDILHADIQGAELEMLNGCKRLIQEERLGYIFLSVHGDNFKPCIEFFENNGFRIIAQHTIQESVSGDGLIVACSAGYGSLKSVAISHYNPARSWFGRFILLVKVITDKRYRKLFALSRKIAIE